MWNMARIGFKASQEMSFENVDDGRTADACLYYSVSAHLWAFGSGELKTENLLYLNIYFMEK